MMHGEVLVVSIIRARKMDSVQAQPVRLPATNDPGDGKSVSPHWETEKVCVTLCTRSTISCVRAWFRAADCCSTRIAPSRERRGKGECAVGVGVVLLRS